MLPKFQHKLDTFLENRLWKEGDDEETLSTKKRFWLLNLPAPIFMFLFGLFFWYLDIQLVAIGMWIFGGFSLLLFLGFTLVRNHIRWFVIINVYFYLLFSFGAVLFLGGIVHSGGAVFIGLAGAMSSLSYLKPKQSRNIFYVYFLSVILEALLQPYLTIRSEITPNINLVLFVLHILVIAGVMFQTISFYIAETIKAKQAEADKLKELDNIKTRFYTNITHEFRTPLTVILGMAEQIIEKPKDHLLTGLKLIQSNGRKLLHLVNQLLSFSKLEAGALPLHYVQSDILRFLRYISEPFKYLSEEKNIRFHFLCDFDKIILDFDPEKIESLISNLLSNAIKHTPEDGDIYLMINLTEEYPKPDKHVFSITSKSSEKALNAKGLKLKITIKDTGSGILQESLNKIFNRYYQSETDSSHPMDGTGIGLSLVKELASVMGGSIFVKSSLGEGSTFTTFLPVSNNAERKDSLSDPLHSTYGLEADAVKQKWIPTSLPHLLVVEDNMDVVHYVKSFLSNEYIIDVAENGAKGIAKAIEIVPDIIVSDIMMPEKDGYELCDTLKNDFRTSHIPIVLLTAKADAESKIVGLRYGADAYVTKPFSSLELQVRLQKLIEGREKLKVKYQLMTFNPDLVKAENPDELFMSKLKYVLETNAGDEDFDINRLCINMQLSRVQLFRKLKALTGQSASHILRSFRLNKAKKLIQSTRMNVSEIAFEVGFKDPAYFTRAFTKEFGFNPSSLRSNLSNS